MTDSSPFDITSDNTVSGYGRSRGRLDRVGGDLFSALDRAFGSLLGGDDDTDGDQPAGGGSGA
ncbi:hypothetical protein [Parafrankia sp. FMc2]|uniref:hypothetical protein n=1 Tax=Parafrankia sp. FMc2 TaxID=3233196 RepID=UPI0034D3DA07